MRAGHIEGHLGYLAPQIAVAAEGDVVVVDLLETRVGRRGLTCRWVLHRHYAEREYPSTEPFLISGHGSLRPIATDDALTATVAFGALRTWTDFHRATICSERPIGDIC